MSTRSTLSALAIAGALTLSACGSDEEEADTARAATTTTMTAMTDHDHAEHDHAEHGHSTSDGEMASLATVTRGTVKVTVMGMGPETFYVTDGDKRRAHKPAADDNIHLMVALADTESGLRLTDGTVTATVTGPDGKIAFDGPLYPMMGRAAGAHYGDNMRFAANGTYELKLVAGPPRIGRHEEVKEAWTKTVKLTAKLRWDGNSASPVK